MFWQVTYCQINSFCDHLMCVPCDTGIFELGGRKLLDLSHHFFLQLFASEIPISLYLLCSLTETDGN